MGNCLNCFKTNNRTNNDHSTMMNGDRGYTADIISDHSNIVIQREEVRELLNSNNTTVSTSQRIANDIPLDTLRQHHHHHINAKKSIVFLNGNAKNMSDITTAVKEHQVSDNTLNALFEEYKDDEEDAILSDGIERLCNDLGYKPEEFPILVLAWRLNASQMCRFTKSEFIQGLQTMNADTIEEIRLRLEQYIDKLKTDAEWFKQLYRFTFRFGLEQGHRTVSLDMAIILWRLVYTVKTPEILNQWLHFLDQHPQIRGVTKDTWNMFLNFAETCDIASYDDTEAWPSLFDDFVEYELERLKDTNQLTTTTTSSSSQMISAINEENEIAPFTTTTTKADIENNNEFTINKNKL